MRNRAAQLNLSVFIMYISCLTQFSGVPSGWPRNRLSDLFATHRSSAPEALGIRLP
jgi:hypothetical protein